MRQSKESTDSPPPLVQSHTTESETINCPVPKDLYCSSCQRLVKDCGVAHEAYEIDVVVKIIKRTFKLHRGECPCGEISFVMPGPNRALEKTIFSPNFIAKVIDDKFTYHLPVYRQQAYFADYGLDLSRQTLNDLVLRSWIALEPVIKMLWRINRRQEIVYVDDSPVCVVTEESRNRYLWCLLTEAAVTFVITEKRNQHEASRVIGDQAEIVMSDAHGCFNGNVVKGQHANCMVHARRLFFKALLSHPKEALEALGFFRDIYKIEELAKKDRLDTESRQILREQFSLPIMEQLKKTIQTYNPAPRSGLGKAVKYFLKHWHKLTVFIRDGRIEADNNGVERQFKMAKLGFKNFLFCQSELGVEAVAGFYSLIATCRLYHVPVRQYLADTLVKLEGGWPNSRIEELLPMNWRPGAGYHDSPLFDRRNLHNRATFRAPFATCG
jgi:transposase